MVLTVCLGIPNSVAVANIFLPVQQPKPTDFDGQGILLEAFLKICFIYIKMSKNKTDCQWTFLKQFL